MLIGLRISLSSQEASSPVMLSSMMGCYITKGWDPGQEEQVDSGKLHLLRERLIKNLALGAMSLVSQTTIAVRNRHSMRGAVYASKDGNLRVFQSRSVANNVRWHTHHGCRGTLTVRRTHSN